jgi:hypothetical protein
MQSARDILNERLAKGEITADEYDTFLRKIGSDGDPKSNETVQQAAKVTPRIHETTEVSVPPEVKKAALYVGGYILLCGVFLIGYPKGDIYASVLKGCGSNSEFCHCVAKSYSEQRTFLLAPFQTFGMFIDKGAAAQCR